MSRRSRSSKTSRERLRALPWALVLRVGLIVGRRWWALPQRDRSRLARLVLASGGRLGNLNVKERAELRKLAGKLDLKGIGGELATLARRGRGRRKRRCRRACA